MEQDETKNLGITESRANNFSEWYSQVIIKSELVDYTDVSGCFAFRPYGYAIWEKIVKECDFRLKKLGVQNVYFPVFIPEKLLKKEQTHVAGFAPEVAWVTHAGNTKLDERLAVRPTSETIMYESYSKWIRSWRDLPFKYAQWNNVVRWEFKHPTPLIRTREFLWCEGHSAFATKEEADQEIKDIMGVWREITEELFGLKGIQGRKSEAEKFAGALASYSIEYLLPNGKTAQGPDAHSDGQNFAKAFDITFLDKDGNRNHVWQNTWAITTRMIGLIVMMHGDDKGLILPPNIAPIKTVIVPITFSKKDNSKIIKSCEKLGKELEMAFVDSRDENTPGRKFNEWELKGVPIRIEIGPRDVEKNQVVIVRRDTGTKNAVLMKDARKTVAKTLDDIQQGMLNRSAQFLRKNIVPIKDMKDAIRAVNGKHVGRGYFCGNSTCEEKFKEKTEAKSLCIDEKGDKGKCILCGNTGSIAYFGKSY